MAEEKEYDFPVFGTQGGGLVREVSQNPFTYIFIEKPDCPGLDVGDMMPAEWGIEPANGQARDIRREEQPDLDMSMSDMLRLIAKYPDPRD